MLPLKLAISSNKDKDFPKSHKLQKTLLTAATLKLAIAPY